MVLDCIFWFVTDWKGLKLARNEFRIGRRIENETLLPIVVGIIRIDFGINLINSDWCRIHSD